MSNAAPLTKRRRGRPTVESPKKKYGFTLDPEDAKIGCAAAYAAGMSFSAWVGKLISESNGKLSKSKPSCK